MWKKKDEKGKRRREEKERMRKEKLESQRLLGKMYEDALFLEHLQTAKAFKLKNVQYSSDDVDLASDKTVGVILDTVKDGLSYLEGRKQFWRETSKPKPAGRRRKGLDRKKCPQVCLVSQKDADKCTNNPAEVGRDKFKKVLGTRSK